ncbi:hypothetical protein NPX13_g1504 [Xylaria arbuscula]|uniref:Rad26-like N-terminal domain-containing protein n=1 Tax=Xylaria arbuscula TaxID=114810 RepID=A0A9W8NKX3_9PEZI|nr:hypothetical protein NPX13_g1504 [Xylaria arbuscula]
MSERAVEAARAAQASATTELEFTRRDLREEVVRAKRHDGPGTPKKNAAAKAWGVSDGFEDVEMAGSPTKGKRGKNAGPVATSVEPSSRLLRTPTKSKRKRPAVDSPVMALETHSDDVVMLDDVRVDDAAVLPMPPSIQGQLSFDYVKTVLNHSAGFGCPLTLEYLAHFKLPSRPNESLASILLIKLSTAGDPSDDTQLPIQFCLEVIRIWDACRKEACLAPITALVALVSFTLQLQTVALAPYISPSLLPVAMDACYEVAIPRFNNSAPGDPTDPEFIKFKENIDTNKILSLLYLAALGARAASQAQLDHSSAGDLTLVQHRGALRRRHAVLVGRGRWDAVRIAEARSTRYVVAPHDYNSAARQQHGGRVSQTGQDDGWLTEIPAEPVEAQLRRRPRVGGYGRTGARAA